MSKCFFKGLGGAVLAGGALGAGAAAAVNAARGANLHDIYKGYFNTGS